MMMISSFLSSSHESDGDDTQSTNPDSFKSYFCFRVFGLSFASDFFNLLLATFHPAEIIVKHLIQRHNNEAWVGVEPITLQS